MIALINPLCRLLLLLALIQSVMLYKIHSSENNPSASLTNTLSSSYSKESNEVLPLKTMEYNDNDDDTTLDSTNDENDDSLMNWLSYLLDAERNEKISSKRSIFPIRFPSSKTVVQRRNNRPHWNPLVAAYKRCGELVTPEEREACFKDAVQRLFVFKLRK